MLIVTGTLSVPVADLPRFLVAFDALAAVTRRRDGKPSYDTAVLDAAVGRLLVVERWRDEASSAEHLHADDTMAFVARWQQRMHADVRQYDAGNERPLGMA